MASEPRRPHNAFQLCINGRNIGPFAGLEGAGGNWSGQRRRLQQPRNPFLENPTTCGELARHLPRTSSPTTAAISEADSPYPATTGCDQLSFNPSLGDQPTTTAADTPSGAEFDLTVPQFESPEVPSPSEIRAADVNLPEGFSLNPNAADGKSTCSDAEARLGTPEEAQCPEDSKVGTDLARQLRSSPGPIPGSVYLGEPQPGNRYRMLLAANGFGVHVKLAGSVTPDPRDRPAHVSFQNLPQTPFADFNLHFFGSERGPLATPTQCGTYAVQSTFTPWDSALPDQTSTQFFNLDLRARTAPPAQAAPRPFNPGFQAASPPTPPAPTPPSRSTSPAKTATRTSAPSTSPPRRASPPPSRASPTAPTPRSPPPPSQAYSGLAEQANPSCPAASQVGDAHRRRRRRHPPRLPPRQGLPRRPLQGRPAQPRLSSPPPSPARYDLGNVVVRAALHVNPETAQITAVSDPLPQILEGIPLRLRQILRQPQPPQLRPQPDQLRPLLGQRRSLRHRRRRRQPLDPLPGRQLRQPPLRPQARPQLLRLDQARRQPRPKRPSPIPRPAPTPTSPPPRSPCPPPSRSTTPTSRTPAPRSSSTSARRSAKSAPPAP